MRQLVVVILSVIVCTMSIVIGTTPINARAQTDTENQNLRELVISLNDRVTKLERTSGGVRFLAQGSDRIIGAAPVQLPKQPDGVTGQDKDISIQLEEPGLLIAYVFGQAGVKGPSPVSSNGVQTFITVKKEEENEVPCSVNQSFDGSANSMANSASSFCVYQLEAGKQYKIRIVRQDIGFVNDFFELDYRYFVIPINP
jgi:hypothetical protein